jgi:hypothetical protein
MGWSTGHFIFGLTFHLTKPHSRTLSSSLKRFGTETPDSPSRPFPKNCNNGLDDAAIRVEAGGDNPNLHWSNVGLISTSGMTFTTTFSTPDSSPVLRNLTLCEFKSCCHQILHLFFLFPPGLHHRVIFTMCSILIGDRKQLFLDTAGQAVQLAMRKPHGFCKDHRFLYWSICMTFKTFNAGDVNQFNRRDLG